MGDKYYYAELNAKGIMELIPATEQQVMDEEFEGIALLDEKSGEIGANFLNDTINRVKGELEQQLRMGLKQTVLACLGFEKDSYGNERGFKVDHCNGRMSEVSKHIAIQLSDILKQCKPEEVNLTDQERTEIITSMRKELLANYKYKLQQNLWSTAESMAREDAKRLAESLLKERSEQVGTLVLEKLFATSKVNKKV